MHRASLLGGTLAVLTLAPLHSFADHEDQTEVLVNANQPEPVPIFYGVRVINGAISPATDIDSFTFHGEAGDRVRVRISTDTNTLDPEYELRGPPPTDVVLNSWNCSAGAAGCRFEREFNLALTGMHRLNLWDLGGNDVGAYTIQLERITPPVIERVLGYDRVVTDTLDHILDLDAFRTYIVAGTTVRFTVTVGVAGLDPEYELYTPAGVPLDGWSCGAGTSGCQYSRTLTVTDTGTYVLLISDQGLDDTGEYQVAMNCLSAACPPAASEFFRNGSGVNPAVYSVLSPALVGGTLHLEIDCAAFPAATAGRVWFYAAGSAGISSSFGEILVNPSSTRFGFVHGAASAGRVMLAQAIPPDVSLAGFFTSTQGAIFGGGVQLTNAVDIVIGH